MSDIRTEYFVRINPRRKGDYGYWIESEYFDSAEEKEKYYAKKCKEIKNNLEEHYKDYEIKDIEIADTSREVELEDEADTLRYQVNEAKHYIEKLKNLVNVHEIPKDIYDTIIEAYENVIAGYK